MKHALFYVALSSEIGVDGDLSGKDHGSMIRQR
jgi:hypothetical protein